MNDSTDFIHRFEPASEQGLPTLLLLHGTGGSEDELVPLARQLVPGAALLSPRGKVLEGGVAARFFRRHAEGVLDVDDLKARTDELAGFIRKAADEYGFDPSGLVALGFSNGANVATALLFRHPDLLAGAALLRPMLPYRPESLPELAGKRVLIDAGAADPMVPADQPPALADLLAEAGAKVTVQMTPGAGHGLTREDLEALTGWFAPSSPGA